MTRSHTITDLAFLTVRDPSAAAEIILARPFPKEVLWTALGLVSVIATILASVSNLLFPVPGPLSGLLSSPFVYLLITIGGLLGTAYAIFWTGRLVGGQGTFEDLLVLILWLQALRAAAQALIIVTLLLAPVLASLMVLAAAAITLWIFVHFVNAALHLGSLLRSVLVVFLGAAALIAIASFLLSLMGLSGVGVAPNV